MHDIQVSLEIILKYILPEVLVLPYSKKTCRSNYVVIKYPKTVDNFKTGITGTITVTHLKKIC